MVRPSRVHRKGRWRGRNRAELRGVRSWRIAGRAVETRLWKTRGGAHMTSLPADTPKKLGLVIDLDTCVGCHACVTSCKEWNTGGYSAPLTDHDPYGADPSGAFLNRVHSFEKIGRASCRERVCH